MLCEFCSGHSVRDGCQCHFNVSSHLKLTARARPLWSLAYSLALSLPYHIAHFKKRGDELLMPCGVSWTPPQALNKKSVHRDIFREIKRSISACCRPMRHLCLRQWRPRWQLEIHRILYSCT